MSALLPAAAGALCGVATLLVMRRFSDQAAIRAAKARIRAHLYELRLFGDDPILMLRAQKKLLLWNMRYMRLALAPAAIIAIPVLLAALQLDALYGKRALFQGEAVVVTAELKPETKLASIDPILTATPSFDVESPSVRITASSQIFWRVRAIGTTDGTLQLKLSDEIVERPIRAGQGLRYVSSGCDSAAWGWVKDGCRIRSNSTKSIIIEYPDGAVSLAGIEAHWFAWFAIVMLAAMLTLRRRFGVTF